MNALKIKSLVLAMFLPIVGAVSIVIPASPVSAACAEVENVELGEVPTSAGNAEEGDCTETTAFSFGECGTDQVGISCLIVEIMSFLSILVGIAVVAGITTGGIVYSTSQGNPGQAQKGVTIITNAVLGLVLYLLMFAIINFLVPGGVLF